MGWYKYGWRPSLPKLGQVYFSGPDEQSLSQFPNLLTLENSLFKSVDQGRIGSCTGNGTAGAMDILLTSQKYPWPFFPSRLMIYYNARALEGSVMSDSGATISDAVAGVAKWGVCPENTTTNWNWAYKDDPFTFRIKPWDQCYKNAVLHKAIKSELVAQNRFAMCSALAAGLPIIIGISVYDSFETSAVADTGIVPMPKSKDNFLGGHCMFVWGIDRAKDVAFVRNSWGNSWGFADHTGRGNCQIPLEYLCNPNLAADFHAISMIGSK